MGLSPKKTTILQRMADHTWSVLCNRGIVDKYTNLVTLSETIDILKIQGLLPAIDDIVPFTGKPIYIVSQWARSKFDKPEDGVTFRYTLLTPDGKKYPQPEKSISLENSPRARFVLQIPSLKYRGPGSYYFLVAEKRGTKKKPRWVEVAKLPFEVQIEQREENEKLSKKQKRKAAKKE